MASSSDDRAAGKGLQAEQLPPSRQTREEIEDPSLVSDPKLRRRLQMRLGQRAFRRRQRLLQRTLNAAEELLGEHLTSGDTTQLPSAPSVKEDLNTESSLPWGGINVLRSCPSKLEGNLVNETRPIVPPSASETVSTETPSRASRSVGLAKQVERVTEASSTSTISTYIPSVLEQIPDLDYWTGIASTFVDSLGPDTPVLRRSRPPSPVGTQRSEAASQGSDIVHAFPESQSPAAHPGHATQVAGSSGGRLLFDRSLYSLEGLERLGYCKPFRSRIDNTFANVGLDQLSVYRAGTDTAGHLLKIRRELFGGLRTMSVFFNWRERVGNASPHPAIPDAVAPSSDMLDCEPLEIQVTQIHHYWIDIVPWPRTRRNILAFAANYANYDEFEIGHDYFTGVRWRGGIPWDGRSYEISEHFYLKWGWILDEYAIATTDYWRRKRGLRSIRSVGPAGSVPRAGIPGKRKLHVDDLEMWGGRDAIGHLVSSSGEVRDPHAA